MIAAPAECPTCSRTDHWCRAFSLRLRGNPWDRVAHLEGCNITCALVQYGGPGRPLTKTSDTEYFREASRLRLVSANVYVYFFRTM